MGYWTRSNSELCLLATKGAPTRLATDVHQIVFAPVGEHSGKPQEVRRRIERLVAGPYLELYGREPVDGWTVWGNEIGRPHFLEYDAEDDINKSVAEGFCAIRERKANGGPGWGEELGRNEDGATLSGSATDLLINDRDRTTTNVTAPARAIDARKGNPTRKPAHAVRPNK
jgi:hypothetical protein